MLQIPAFTHILIHYSWSKDHGTLDWSGITHYHNSYRVDGVIVSRAEYLVRRAQNDGKIFERPWGDNGYHYGIEQINNIYEVLLGRPLYKRGVHCKGMNEKAIGICFVGNYDTEPPPDIALQICASRIIAPLMLLKPVITLDHIEPHRKYATYKTCPGKKFDMEKLRAIVKDVLQRNE